MKFLNSYADYIERLNATQFRNYVLMVGIIFLFISGFFWYRYYSAIRFENRRIARINQLREEVRDLLERYELVKKQQEAVDIILEKDRTFKIAGFFDSLIQELGLKKFVSREPDTTTEELDNGYTEVKLYAGFSKLDMKKVADFLDALEKNDRIHTKELELYKPDSNKTVNMNIIIATLEPRPEVPEGTES